MADVQNWSTIERVVLRKGVSRRVFSGKKSMMVLNEIAPGTTPPNTHSHPHEQLVYIVQGEGNFVLGDETLAMKAGDLLVVPPNVPHTFKNTGSQACLNLDIFSPIRDDYLPPQK
jgi:quercetin dioxygenase-like cupin family protein